MLNKISFNESYWRIKKVLEDELEFSAKHKIQIKRLKKKENIYFDFFAEKRFIELNDIEKDKLLLTDEEILSNEETLTDFLINKKQNENASNKNLNSIENIQGIPISD